MAFAPQYNTNYNNHGNVYNNNGNHNNNNNNNNINNNINNNHYHNPQQYMNRHTTPRRVQFAMNGDSAGSNESNASNKSLPNPNPLRSQESMPYRPELNQYQSNRSPPQLSKDIKSIEINSKMKQVALNSNHSTPESILNEPIPSTSHYQNDSQINTNTRLTMNTSNSILVTNNNYKQNLINQESHKIVDNDDEHDNNQGIDKFDSRLPITGFSNNNHNNNNSNGYNHHNHNNNHNKGQQYYGQQRTISNASYDHIPGLYSTNSTTQVSNNDHPPSLPNATSIALTTNESSNINEMKMDQMQPQQPKRKLSLTKHFNNDKVAFETWMAACDIQDDTFGILYYIILCIYYISICIHIHNLFLIFK